MSPSLSGQYSVNGSIISQHVGDGHELQLFKFDRRRGQIKTRSQWIARHSYE